MPVPTRLALLIAAAILVTCAPVVAQQREQRTVETSTTILQEFTGISENSIPPALLHDAQAIAIIPNLLKGGFLVGGTFGRGVLVVRDPAGAWSNPIFVTFGGGSFGFQAGIHAIDLILVFRNRRAVDSFLMGKGKITLGLDAAVSAGPIGRRAMAGTDVKLSSEILTYSRSRGLFAGVSAEGAVLKLDWKSLASYYQQVVSPTEILGGSPIPAPASAQQLHAVLGGATVAPGPVIPIDPGPNAPPVEGLLPDEELLPDDPSARLNSGGGAPIPQNPNVRTTTGGGDVVIDPIPQPTALRAQSHGDMPAEAPTSRFRMQWRKRKPRLSSDTSLEPLPEPVLIPAPAGPPR